MADNTIKIVLDAADNASADIRKVSQEVDGLSESAAKASGQMESFGSMVKNATAPAAAFVGAITAAAAGVVAFGIHAVNSARDAMEVQNQLQAVLESTGGVAGVTAEQAMRMATAWSWTSKYEDDAILSSENLLLTFTNIGKNVFPQALSAVVNMSAALGQDLKSSAIQVGKALNDPIQGITALSRVGVSFTEDQKSMIQSLIDTGKTAQAQQLIISELMREFGGSAEKTADSVTILKNQVGELWEAIGMKMLPTIEKIASAIDVWIDTQGGADVIIGKLMDRVKVVTDFLIKYKDVTLLVAAIIGGAFASALLIGAAALVAFMAPLIPFLVVGGLIAGGIYLIVKAVQSFIDLIPTIKAVWQATWSAITSEISTIGAAISSGINNALEVMSNAWVAFRDAVIFIVDGLVQGVVGFFTSMWSGITMIWGTIVSFFTMIWQGIVLVFNTALALLVGLVIVAFQAMGINILAVIKSVEESISAFWASIKQTFLDSLTAINLYIAHALQVISDLWQSVWSAVVEVAMWAWNGIAGLISEKTTEATTTVTGFVTATTSVWTAAWSGISTFFTNIWNGISGKIKAVTAEISAVFAPWIQSLSAAWSGFWTAAGSVVASAWEGIKGVVKAGINNVISQLNAMINAVNSVIAKGAGAIGVKAITLPNVPMLAKGGEVVGAGDVIVGENGPERLSLPRGASVTPLKGNTGGQGDIIVNVTGNTFGSNMDPREVAISIGDELIRALQMQVRV